MFRLNPRFFDLPEERRRAILNGALDAFAAYDYKKASTEDIARRAGVSKALLFHYFGSKRELYLYLYDYATRFVVTRISASSDPTETDFFRLIVGAQMAKLAILHEHPSIMRFITRAYFEEDDTVRPALAQGFGGILTSSSARFLARADRTKLREGISPEQLLNIVLWMAEGFMRSRTPAQLEDLEALNEAFLTHVELLRRQFYKEEYL